MLRLPHYRPSDGQLDHREDPGISKAQGLNSACSEAGRALWSQLKLSNEGQDFDRHRLGREGAVRKRDMVQCSGSLGHVGISSWK